MRERLIRLLNILANSEGENIKRLSEELDVTTKTVRNEIKEINELLASNNLPNFLVKNGLIINNLTQNQRVNLIDRFALKSQSDFYLSPNQRLIYLLLEFLSAKDPVFIVNEQDSLQVSKSTMDSDMRDLRRLVQPYGLRITTDPKKGVRVVGNERAIRAMFEDVLTHEPSVLAFFDDSFSNLNSLTTKVNTMISFHDVKFIKKTLLSIFPKSPMINNDNYFRQIILLIIIWIVRVKNQNYVSSDPDDDDISVTSKQSNFVDLIVKHFHLAFDDNSEKKYLAFAIGSFDSSSDSELIDWTKSQIITLSLIEWMESSLGFPFSKSENLFERIYKHITALLKRIDQHLNVYNPLGKTIMQSYPKIFNAVDLFFKKNNQKYHINLSNDEIGYLAIYFSTAQSEIQQKQAYVYRVAVVCNYGLATGRLLATKLEEQFNVDVIAVLGTAEIGVLRKLPISLVFKTTNVSIEGIPSVKLNPIPSDVDLKIAENFLKKHSELSKYEGDVLEPTKLFDNILSLLKKNNIRVDKNLFFDLQHIFEANKLEINERKIQPMLKDLVNNNQIQLQVEAKNWRDAIKISAQPLLDQNFISESYVKAMIESVNQYGPYIVIGPSIALAHARPEDGAHKLGVTITTLKNPIKFGNAENDPVKIIFCLAAVDNYSHLNVMKAIVQLINDPQKVEQLAQITDLKNFKNVLFNSFLTKERT